ncbi:MAG: hypothetical protein IPL10_20680 [Bacteroidetes bacterium]|nr:hypothetical protein [Bacteroidota bacterium]
MYLTEVIVGFTMILVVVDPLFQLKNNLSTSPLTVADNVELSAQTGFDRPMVMKLQKAE